MTPVDHKTFSTGDLALPYGGHQLRLPDDLMDSRVDVILPNQLPPASNPEQNIIKVLSNPIGVDKFAGVSKDTRVALVLNDKTRPVPNSILVAPLLEYLRSSGVPKKNISFFIANGTHVPMSMEELGLIIDADLVRGYSVVSHDCDRMDALQVIGGTPRGTPVYVNKQFLAHDLKIVIGDIEPHHFAGFSGGVKSAAIGLCGRQTINTNHELLLDKNSRVGIYQANPLRADIEDIGRMIGIDLALNAVLSENKEIIEVFFGEPVSVMQAGINTIRKICQIPVDFPYDVVFASAGGYPKDINLYQSQKAMTHASLFCRKGGKIVLVAECREGIGSESYAQFMRGLSSPDQVIVKFKGMGFSVGPHKAYQIARILQNHEVFLASSLPNELTKSLLLNPLSIDNFELPNLPKSLLRANDRIALLPYATACIPVIDGGTYD